MSLSINPFTAEPSPTGSSASSESGELTSSAAGSRAIPCPSCGEDIAPYAIGTGWETCPYCATRVEVRAWPVVRRSNNVASVLSDHATCFFHPDKAFQACCQRCGRFMCALCDLQLGAEHVCPACFERGLAESSPERDKADWRHRDVLYDSIALTVGWAWILFWPVIVAAIPAVIVLHVKFRKAPRQYVVPRSGWRFWMAYVGLVWLPLLFVIPYFTLWMARRPH